MSTKELADRFGVGLSTMSGKKLEIQQAAFEKGLIPFILNNIQKPEYEGPTLFDGLEE